MTADTAAELRISPSPLRRALALVSFAGRTVASGWTFRASVIYAWAAAVGYTVLSAVWASRGESVAGAAVVTRALVWISWAAGTAAWVAARNVEATDARLGLDALAALRGASPRAFFTARVVATIALLTRAVGLPALFLSIAVGVIGQVSGAGSSGIRMAGPVVVYSIIFGVVFGGLARISSQLSPRHGRLLFAAIVLGPEILRGVLGDVPSLVSGFGELIDLLSGTGGGAA